MSSSIRARILVWLMIVLLPVLAASVIAIDIVDADLSRRLMTDLENVRRLEVARVEQMLDTYEQEAASFAAGRHVIDFTAAVGGVRDGTLPDDTEIAGHDGFLPVDATRDRPLRQLVNEVQAKSRSSSAHAVEFRIRSAAGDVLGETDGFSWESYDGQVVEATLETAEPRFGNAFRNRSGDTRVGYVAPILTSRGQLVGAIEMEMDLGPVTDFVVAHEGLGRSSEAHIAQPNAAGDAEFITLLRFERDAAFTKVVPSTTDVPITRSLDAIDGATVVAPDYRGTESILSFQTIERTGWGLVVKIDRAEALGPVARVRRVIAIAGAVAAAAVLIGWAVFLRPVGRRLRRAAAGARNVAAGRHAPIDDESRDEIGDIARTIDRLAEDLADDHRLRAEYERELVRRATQDDLTGLVNRRHATALVADLIERSDGSASSLLFIDLDGFKSINDTYGHLVGDEVLAGVAARLRDVTPPDSIVCRWGGDEFVVVLPGQDAPAASAIAQHTRDSFECPLDTSVGPQTVRASLGTSTTAPGDTLDHLLGAADGRMFEEKLARKGRTAVCSAMLREVENALVEDRIEAHLQPIVEFEDDGTTGLWGAEALVRLRRTDGTLEVPAAFLEAAQDNHLGAAIDDRVAAIAIDQVGRWFADGRIDPDFRLTLNVCEASTRDREHPDRLARILARSGVDPASIILEISEETRQLDPVTMGLLEHLGVGIAIDDIGIGRSGIARMIDSRAGFGKIDGRWVRESLGGPGTTGVRTPMVARIDELCQRLGMDVVVEGVETDEQRAVLTSLGITRAQGYLFGRPIAGADFADRWCRTSAAAGRSPAR